jgi:hypothetical protein
MRLLLILAVGFIACTQPNTTQQLQNKDALLLSKTDSPIVQPQNSFVNYDSTIYNQFIPLNVRNLVKLKLPQWHLPNPNTWEAVWFDSYKKDSVLVNYVSADFNCDSKQDYALLLINEKQEFAIWVLQSQNEDYKPIRLYDLGNMGKPLEVGIEHFGKGALNYLDENAEDVKSIMLKCPAIQVMFFEKTAVTYYWENGKYNEVQTGD